jgi:hypothetical protein
MHLATDDLTLFLSLWQFQTVQEISEPMSCKPKMGA